MTSQDSTRDDVLRDRLGADSKAHRVDRNNSPTLKRRAEVRMDSGVSSDDRLLRRLCLSESDLSGGTTDASRDDILSTIWPFADNPRPPGILAGQTSDYFRRARTSTDTDPGRAMTSVNYVERDERYFSNPTLSDQFEYSSWSVHGPQPQPDDPEDNDPVFGDLRRYRLEPIDLRRLGLDMDDDVTTRKKDEGDDDEAVVRSTSIRISRLTAHLGGREGGENDGSAAEGTVETGGESATSASSQTMVDSRRRPVRRRRIVTLTRDATLL